MSKIEKQLQDKIKIYLQERGSALIEVKKLKQAITKNCPKKEKWLMTLSNRILELDRYILQNQNRLQGIKTRENVKNVSIERKNDTRRKILIGAWIENEIKQGNLNISTVKNGMNNFLTRDIEIQLFHNYEERF